MKDLNSLKAQYEALRTELMRLQEEISKEDSEGFLFAENNNHKPTPSISPKQNSLAKITSCMSRELKVPLHTISQGLEHLIVGLTTPDPSKTLPQNTIKAMKSALNRVTKITDILENFSILATPESNREVDIIQLVSHLLELYQKKSSNKFFSGSSAGRLADGVPQ